MKANPHTGVLTSWAIVVFVGGIVSCGFMRGDYFRDEVNEATQEIVEKQYGEPHKRQELADGGETWIYYRRGSATASYAGQSRTSSCQAYHLTFDKERVLRDWKRESCR